MAPRKASATTKTAAASKPKANTGAKVTMAAAKTATKKAAPKKPSTSSSTDATGAKTGTKRKADGEAENVPASKNTTKATAPKEAAAPKTAAPKKATTCKETASKKAATPKKAAAPKKTAPKKAAPKKETATKAAPKEETAAEEAAPEKTTTDNKRKATAEAERPPPKKVKVITKGPTINEPPTERLNVFVMGEGGSGELGLGTSKKSIDVKRARLHPLLAADTVGVVAIEAGGMHSVALTHDNKILTWGVNDDGALGRDTAWDGGLKDMKDADDMDDESDDDDELDDNGLNPRESVPGEVDFSGCDLPEGTRWTCISAGDSTGFAVTDDGRVYGWGTFRTNEGPFGFTKDVKIARTPILLDDLKNITSVTSGDNHAFALDSNGAVFAWGSGQQGQLGRRVVERTKASGLVPREIALPKGRKANRTVGVYSGSAHSFAIGKNGEVRGWGLNNFGQTGVPNSRAGEENASVEKPERIFEDEKVTSITGGNGHTIMCTADGKCLTLGRANAAALGIVHDDLLKMPEDVLKKNQQGKPGMVLTPQHVTAVDGKVVAVGSGGEHGFAITDAGKAYSWGFSVNYQTGQGMVQDDVPVATIMIGKAIDDQKLTGATAGGQFSILYGPAAQ